MSDLTKDLEARKERQRAASYKKRYEELITEYEAMKRELHEAFKLKKPPVRISFPRPRGRKSESTAVIVASDWHIEEVVKSSDVNGVNRFDAGVAKERIGWFIRNSLKLVQMHKEDAHITRVVLLLLGDFITSNIHDELVEITTLRPGDAAWLAQNYLSEVIEAYLKEGLPLTIVGAPGNHSRITKSVHISTEAGNSLETYLYRNLANRFPQTNFVVAEGYHTYLKIYDTVLRIHHGHHIRYAGGVGGITIPLNKAIAQWNRTKRADVDVLAHFHSRKDGGNFVVNGSLIGYNAYALSIKADYEPPQQTFFLVHSNFGKTEVAPIILEEV